MPSDRRFSEPCNCLALRQAARAATRFYDHHLASSGLRTTQFSILAILKNLGPTTINALASELVMDRTTLGRNILPLIRDGLLRAEAGVTDRRSKTIHLTPKGTTRLRLALGPWAEAQKRFKAIYGAGRSSDLRSLLSDLISSEINSALFIPGSID